MLLDILPYVMDIITVVHPTSSLQAGPRNPLLPKITSPQSVQAKNIRRKESFIRTFDSSEGSPLSSDNSIFEAFLFSNSNSEDSITACSRHAVSDGSVHNNENMRHASISTRSEPIPTTEFLYGHGTVLDTITEQRSYGTIRTVARTKSADDISTCHSISRARSADDISTTPLLGHRDSFILAKDCPRRKQSFSLDDIWSIKGSYHDACAMIDQAARRRDRATQRKISIHEVYAKPKEPLLAPPERPDTPPGCPSWTEAQRPGPRQHLIPHHTRLQRLLRMPSSGLTLSPTPSRSFFTGRVVSAPGLTRLPPRFRVPRSVYSAIETHPFSSAPIHKSDSEPPIEAPRPVPAPVPGGNPRTVSVPAVAPIIASTSKVKGKAKSKLVRFTPSATARDSEMVDLQHAMEATSSTALHPLVDTVYDNYLQAPPKPICPHRKAKQQNINEINNRFTSPITAYNVPQNNDYLPLSSITSLPRVTLTPSTQNFHPLLNESIRLHLSPNSNSPSRNSISLDQNRRLSISPSLISEINAESSYISDDVDLSTIDLERENRGSIHSRDRDMGTPLAACSISTGISNMSRNRNENESGSANANANANAYYMSGALHIPEPESPGRQAVHVPILTGARMLDVVSPSSVTSLGMGMGIEKAGGTNEEPFCWKCKLGGVKKKVEGWLVGGGEWICFVCWGGTEEGWGEGSEHGNLNGYGSGNGNGRAEWRREVLGAVPGVGI